MRNTLLIIILLLISGICKSQNPVTGSFIGQSVQDHSVLKIEVKQNHKYILKTYDNQRKVQKKIKGTWSLAGDKLVLTEKNGTVTELEKYDGVWYINDKSRPVLNSYSYLAKMYQNKNSKEFWGELKAAGC